MNCKHHTLNYDLFHNLHLLICKSCLWTALYLFNIILYKGSLDCSNHLHIFLKKITTIDALQKILKISLLNVSFVFLSPFSLFLSHLVFFYYTVHAFLTFQSFCYSFFPTKYQLWWNKWVYLKIKLNIDTNEIMHHWIESSVLRISA